VKKYTYTNSKGTESIHVFKTYVDVYNQYKTIKNVTSFEDFLKKCEDLVLNENSNIHQNAFNKCRGDWYELLISLSFWDFKINNQNCNYLVSLPNVKQFDLSELYVSDIETIISDLKEKVYDSAKVSFITSNPDFVIISKEIDIHPLQLSNIIDIDLINKIENYYKSFVGKCDFEQILGFVAAKSSLRPDRRLQIPHEGSLMKSLYRHIQTRKWIIDAKGIKYYTACRNYTTSDKIALSTIATHSIIDVKSKPESAVDDYFVIDSWKDTSNLFSNILFN